MLYCIFIYVAGASSLSKLSDRSRRDDVVKKFHTNKVMRRAVFRPNPGIENLIDRTRQRHRDGDFMISRKQRSSGGVSE